MRKPILAVPLAALLVVSATTPVLAVNCDQVKKELKLGRWPEDIALGMNITLAQVNSCKEQPGTSTTHSTTAPKGGSNRNDSSPHVTPTRGS